MSLLRFDIRLHLPELIEEGQIPRQGQQAAPITEEQLSDWLSDTVGETRRLHVKQCHAHVTLPMQWFHIILFHRMALSRDYSRCLALSRRPQHAGEGIR